MPDAVLLFPPLLYLALLGISAFAVALPRRDRPAARARRVAVIVAARNEEQNIGPCLRSLASQDYPADLFEVIVVDDGSTDATPRRALQEGRQIRRFRLISATRPGGEGKAAALARACDATDAEFYLFTDADCTVPPRWISRTVGHFRSPRTGAVAGFTLLSGSGIAAGVQALDWLFLFSLAAAWARLRYPLTAVGTNLAVRAEAYRAAGGFPGIPFSVTEDMALVRAVTRGGRYRLCFPLDPQAMVQSAPCAGIGELLRQKKRWFTGGTGFPAPVLLLFSVLYLFHVGLLAALWSAPLAGVYLAAAKGAADLLLILPALVRLRCLRLLPLFPLMEAYLWAYVTLIPPMVLVSRRVEWKGRVYHGKGPP
ncbi:MAG: glycosyltransferase [Bacteroidota bacterium]